ncbi:hypothetical protein KY318_02805, partial [Candidatus Woesearchaeota archaeon]|nr:hypothetical protein [Candidatus Woesearchaeota archaeon]
LPARWGIDSKHGIHITEIKTPSRIPTLAPQSYRKPLTDSEWTNFVKSCRTLVELYRLADKLETNVRRRMRARSRKAIPNRKPTRVG